MNLNSSRIDLTGTSTKRNDEIEQFINTSKKQKGVSSSGVNNSKLFRKKYNVNRSDRDIPDYYGMRSASHIPHSEPEPKKKNKLYRKTFTVIGNRVTKDFIYCVKMLQGLHKYRRQHFATPIIRGVTAVEWPHVLNELRKSYGGSALCASGPIVVLRNGYYLGGAKELKDLIEETYIYHMVLNYAKESIYIFKHFVKLTGRGCAYMHICVNDEPIGSFIFLLYSDICPKTCENFSRLCHTTKGGYSGTPVHRVVEDGWIQCGGFGLKEVPLGCENFIVPHDQRGVLGMCNADRGVDCSTQFFVLLQPSLWMNHKYVAFGQLIEGEETLKKIEQIPTFYESPTKNITIFKAGLLNLDCDDIMVNRGAVAYIDQHIDDLVSIEEMLHEWLWQLVETDIEARKLKDEVTMGMDSQRPTAVPAPQSVMTPKDDSYQSIRGEEEHSPSQTPVSGIKEKRPYYIPLTDVPYSGERDSNYDLKRFLQGAYCLESDLDPRQPKEIQKSRREKGKEFSAISGIMFSYSQALQVISDIHDSSSSSSESEELDEYDKKTYEDYLRENGDKVSFAGSIVKSIAKTYIKRDLSQHPHDTFAEEEIRRIRLAFKDLKLKAEQHRKVSVGVSPWDAHSQIKRRQTGFTPFKFNAEDRDEQDEDDEDDKDHKDDKDDEDYEESKKGRGQRSVSISEDSRFATTIKIQRRQTGFVKSFDIDQDTDELDTEKTNVGDGDERPIAKKMSLKASQSECRPSVLLRLYEDLAIGSEPTLKDFKPVEQLKKDSFDKLEESKGYLRRDTHPYFSQNFMAEEAAELATAQAQSKFYPGKKRHTLTISAYKLKNQLYAEKMKNQTKQNQKK